VRRLGRGTNGETIGIRLRPRPSEGGLRHRWSSRTPGDVDRRVAPRAARLLLSVGGAENDDGHAANVTPVQRYRLFACQFTVFSVASRITSEIPSRHSIELCRPPRCRRSPESIARSPATPPTSPIGRTIQHDRARGALNADPPRPWSASGQLPYACSEQCPSPLAEWRMPHSWEPSAVQTACNAATGSVPKSSTVAPEFHIRSERPVDFLFPARHPVSEMKVMKVILLNAGIPASRGPAHGGALATGRGS
jgi:hypothetical protein